MRPEQPCLFWAKRLPSALLPTKTVWQARKSTLFAERPRRRRRCQRRNPRPRNSVAPRCFRHSFELLCDASAPVSMLELDASSPSRRSLCFTFFPALLGASSFQSPRSSALRSPRSRTLFEASALLEASARLSFSRCPALRSSLWALSDVTQRSPDSTDLISPQRLHLSSSHSPWHFAALIPPAFHWLEAASSLSAARRTAASGAYYVAFSTVDGCLACTL